MKQPKEITYRHIAIMFAKALPIDGDEFRDKVNEYSEVIKSLPANAKVALRSAYIFSSKVPREEREDLFQELALAILKSGTNDAKLGYAIARCDWCNWWKKYYIRSHYSLDSVIEDDEGNKAAVGDLIIGEAEFERKMCDKIECQRIWQALPDKIKPIVTKRLMGQPLLNTERAALSYWVRTKGYRLLLT